MAGALTLATALLATACSGTGGGGESSQADANTITFMTKLFGTAPNPQGELHQAIEKFLGKKIQVTWVPNADYQEKVNVTLASANIPDVMVVNPKSPAFGKAAAAGAFWDLTDKIKKYPNLVGDEKVLLNSSINGKIYGPYRTRPLLRSAVMIRADWLKKVGLEAPKTTDDLYKIAEAFTKKDPDGNGKDDTYGLIIPKWPGVEFAASNPFNVIDVWFGAPNNWGERDGKLVPEFDTPEFFEANRFTKKMIDEGLVNPDWNTLDTAKWNDPFVQNKGGIIIDVDVRTTQLLDLLKEQDPQTYGDKVLTVGNLSRPDGKKFSLPFSGYNDILAVSKQRVKTEAQLDELLKTLDKLASKEGQVLLSNGIEGRNFKVENGEAVLINQEDPKVKQVQDDVDKAFIQLGTQASTGTTGIAYPRVPPEAPYRKDLAERKERVAEDLKTAVFDPSLPVVPPTLVAKGATLNPIVTDARIKYLAGQLTEEQLKAEIKRWYDSGGTQIAQEINDLVSKLGQ
ncbi:MULTISPECIES: extracellular solute-binding protein [unclassified Nonomuraea]|uniref:extracellular solute-binding protein n=1 Tax=unclassified Nonomuraea TaxID=2593643 RepID=UPI00273AE85E|nr:extracellular solute-binding protein [Nonomuraea sp. G32]MDP4507729.1 extracellular solute-binding protein [Nonomuraea sp. G32]